MSMYICRYSLVDSHDERFIIDRYTGVISTAAPLDREERSEYLLVVMATDRGLLAQSSTARVVVRVEDVNDHTPKFQRQSYVAQIPDGVAAGLCRLSLSLFLSLFLITLTASSGKLNAPACSPSVRPSVCPIVF